MSKTPKERPILFNAEMVQAVLDGRKTQTRRVIIPQPALLTVVEKAEVDDRGYINWIDGLGHEHQGGKRCPYGAPGDRLYVRETHQIAAADVDRGLQVIYRADGRVRWVRPPGFVEWARKHLSVRWRPSIHMPRWASRILLEVTEVRVERVQDISERDAFEEGISGGDWLGDPCGEFLKLWDSINAKRGFGWRANPWVWVVGFRVIKPTASPTQTTGDQ